MELVVATLIVVCLISVVHVTSLATAAHLTGVPVREISFGMGGQLLRFGIVKLRYLPFGGHIKLKHTQTEELSPAESHDAFDRQPAWVQALIPLSACIGVLGVSMLMLGSSAWPLFIAGFWQFFVGALAPLSSAQVLINDFVGYLKADGFTAGFGFLCAKVAAINLLPLPLLNGGDAIMALLGVHNWSERLELRLKQISLTLLLLLYGSWLVAIGTYIWRAAA